MKAMLGLVSLCALAWVPGCVRSSTTPPAARYAHTAPRAQPMDGSLAAGLYRTSFGPVKIEADREGGPGRVMGVWSYERDGEPVVGFFAGRLEGNVLGFMWQEPADPAPLAGRGYLVFESDGSGFFGRWWTEGEDRGGEWSGEKAYPMDGESAPDGEYDDEPVEGDPDPGPEDDDAFAQPPSEDDVI